jgi:hypothetical protein
VFVAFASVTVDVLPDSCALAWALQDGAASSAAMINAAVGAFFKYFIFPPSTLSLHKHEYGASRSRRTSAVAPQLRARCPFVNDSGSSLGRFDPDVIRGQNFRIGKFGFDPYPLETSFLLWHSEEDQEVLIVESLLESVQVRFEADQIGRSQGVAFTAGLFRDLRQS